MDKESAGKDGGKREGWQGVKQGEEDTTERSGYRVKETGAAAQECEARRQSDDERKEAIRKTKDKWRAAQLETIGKEAEKAQELRSL